MKNGICEKCNQPESAHSYGRCPGDISRATYIHTVTLWDANGHKLDERTTTSDKGTICDLVAALKRDHKYAVHYAAIYSGGWCELSPTLLNPAWSRWTDGTRPEAIVELTRLTATMERIHAMLGQ
jgi:hypothetical protein